MVYYIHMSHSLLCGVRGALLTFYVVRIHDYENSKYIMML